MAVTEWVVSEIDDQLMEALPRRETLFFDVNITNVVGVNLAIAVNAASIGVSAAALANQQVAALS